MFPTVRVIVAFDLRRVVGLLNGAAYARAVLRHSMLGFERFSENSVMNAVIMAMTGQPGLAEVHQDIGAINSERRKIFTILVDAACEALKSGPAAFVNFLESLQAERDKNLHEVQKIFQTARNIDQNIAGRMQSAIRGCAMVQFGSTIILAATPLGLTFAGASTAVGAGVVGFGYSITKSLVKDMAEAKHARVIAFDMGKDYGQRKLDEKADAIVDRAIKHIESQEELINEAEKKISDLTRSAARKMSNRKMAKLGRQVDRAQKIVTDAERLAKIGKYTKIAGRSLQVVFAAHDIYESWQDFQEAWDH